MGLVNTIKYLSKREKIIISSIAALIVIAVIATVAIIANNRYLATTMRLLRVEGTVNIEDSTGATKPVIDNIRFQSGDALSTGSDGLASVGLDDTKIVTLENDSRVEFQKHDKQLELTLTKGALFFEVTEKLADDETYEIKTSNMTVGIRGTSGYVYYSDSGLQSLIITDGVVKVTGYNPKTNETKEVEVRGGESVTAYLYDEATEDRDSIEFEVKEVPVEELPEFPLQMLAENDALLDKVCADTGWDKEELLTLVTALTDPDNPTPTPDEIIEITDTPTPTEKPKATVTVTPTPTDTTTPTPSPSTKPSSSATGTPTPSATSTPGSSTTTPTATPKITTTPSATPKPTTTVKPTATPTVKPTATPTVATYTVTFITNNKCTAPATQTITEGSKATKPSNPSAEGYTFGGWYKDSACTNAYNFNSAVTSNVVLYAKWTHITYTVSFDMDDLGTAPEDQTVNHGDKVKVPSTPTATGHTFTGWYTNNDLTEEYDFDSEVTSDITLYAGWDTNTYTVTFYANGHGTAPGAQTVYYGDSAEQPSKPSATGYTFGGWYTNSDCTDVSKYDFDSEITSDVDLYAKWTSIICSVVFVHGHDMLPGSQYVEYNGTVTKPEDPTLDGYTFDGWYSDSSFNNPYDFNKPVTENLYIYAKWTEIQEPTLPSSAYSKYEKAWGLEYQGHPVYVCYSGSGFSATYLGYVDGNWIPMEQSGALDASTGHSSNYFYYMDGNQMVYYYFWGE